MNHACVCLDPLSNSAVPVLPYTGPPATFRNPVPVPLVTTSRIIDRSALAASPASASPAGAGFGGGGSSTSFGCSNRPRATAAVAAAIASGLTTVAPCPNVAAANSVGLPPFDTLPLNASTPRSHAPPRPSAVEALRSPSAPRRGASPTNAVLHDRAKSTWNCTLPSASLWAFLKVRPSTFRLRGHSTTVLGVTFPFCSSPYADTILN